MTGFKVFVCAGQQGSFMLYPSYEKGGSQAGSVRHIILLFVCVLYFFFLLGYA